MCVVKMNVCSKDTRCTRSLTILKIAKIFGCWHHGKELSYFFFPKSKYLDFGSGDLHVLLAVLFAFFFLRSYQRPYCLAVFCA